MDAGTRQRIERLRSLAVLRHLPEGKLEELTRVLEERVVPAGGLVFEEGSVGDTLYLLALGQVRIEKRVEAGEFAELALLSPGDVFGEMALIENVPRSARAVAHTEVTLFVLGRQDLDRWLASEPMMAVGFFVELLRVLSHRLRRSSQELVLLYDLSHLAVQRFEDETGFLRAVLHRIVPHLDGDWSAAAYLYNEFNEDVSRIGVEGARGESLPRTLPHQQARSRWLDAGSFCVALTAKAATPLGFLVARNELPMSPLEQGEVEVALTAAGHLVASALVNIKHDAEERLRARLHQQTYGSPL
jgi:CRP/FNR family transcriptional regulator, cyclic AMP receptor protein